MTKKENFKYAKWALINTFVLLFGILFYIFGSMTLKEKGMAFSRYMEYPGIALCVFLMITLIGQICFYILKYAKQAKNKLIKLVSVIVVCGILSASLYGGAYASFIAIFAYRPFAITEKEGQKMFVYSSERLGDLDYYTYYNLFIRSKAVRIQEDFANRETKSVETYGAIPRETTYYDENGKPIKGINCSRNGDVISSWASYYDKNGEYLKTIFYDGNGNTISDDCYIDLTRTTM